MFIVFINTNFLFLGYEGVCMDQFFSLISLPGLEKIFPGPHDTAYMGHLPNLKLVSVQIYKKNP